jgi:hypothetical protein
MKLRAARVAAGFTVVGRIGTALCSAERCTTRLAASRGAGATAHPRTRSLSGAGRSAGGKKGVEHIPSVRSPDTPIRPKDSFEQMVGVLAEWEEAAITRLALLETSRRATPRARVREASGANGARADATTFALALPGWLFDALAAGAGSSPRPRATRLSPSTVRC